MTYINPDVHLQFVGAVLNVSRPHLDKGKKAKFAFFEQVTKLTRIDLKVAGVGIKPPDALGPDWKTLLATLLQDLTILEPRVVLALHHVRREEIPFSQSLHLARLA